MQVQIDLEGLKSLREHTLKCGTLLQWTDLAIEYIEACEAEIRRLREKVT